MQSHPHTDVLHNAPISAVRDSVRSRALQDLEFFANNVLGLNIAEDVCAYTQDVLDDHESLTVRTSRSRALAQAIISWLGARNITVLTDIALPKHEILSWLEVDEEPTDPAFGCTIRLVRDGVELTWL